MLPDNHVIVEARASYGCIDISNTEAAKTTITFSDWDDPITPEKLLSWVSSDFPKNVLFTGNPLHSDLEFLQMVLVDLTNSGKIVTVVDFGDRILPWKLVMPGVRFKLRVDINFNFKNYRRLGEKDTVIFCDIDDEASYQIARAHVEHVQKNRLSTCQFALSGSWPRLTEYVLGDRLETIVHSTGSHSAW